MRYSADRLLNDLSPFADLGTEAPVIRESGGSFIVRMSRDASDLELIFSSDGAVEEREAGRTSRHRNLRALLASPKFADIGRWADAQLLRLKQNFSQTSIELIGTLSTNHKRGNVNVLDDHMSSTAFADVSRTNIVLIDGPAGIGKTSVIRSLCRNRAENYRRTQRPVVLHVESRGRMLQNLSDLMAFSLQTLRSTVTYDQVPALVRNGLVSLAIDGFDELGDPNGYELAWAQVNELIKDCRGSGTIILSGRETFIGRDRLLSALTGIDPGRDAVDSFTLNPVDPEVAREWLRSSGWTQSILDSEVSKPLFENNSYALRPFFLSELAGGAVAEQLARGEIDDLLSFIVRSAVVREAGKFGRDVEAVTTREQRERFVWRMMEEIARDLAENQTDAIASESVAWIAEMVAPEMVPESVISILKNRAGVLAFLTVDERRGFRRFSHEQISNYFLSHVTFESIVNGEVPKFIRRNIYGTDFLENFCSVARSRNPSEMEVFIQNAIRLIDEIPDYDRARRNLGALVIASACVASPSYTPVLKFVSLDEVYTAETISNIVLDSVSIAQLYAREADLRNMEFNSECYIGTIIADGTFIPSDPMPRPSRLDLPDRMITVREEIEKWLRRQYSLALGPVDPADIDRVLGRFPLFNLLQRIARYKPFWIKDGDDRNARRILDDPDWPVLSELMKKHELLVEREDVPASGRPGTFFHVRKRQSLLQLIKPDEAIMPFLRELLKISFDGVSAQLEAADKRPRSP
ncbi:hypothetical protein FG93_02537 [Bosea sp. LC85]|uniref:hypothetical protein n=1 Tax=Bosea sp. LC85 TaxID=1502851 RepID=UPI0004E373B3|nr:hypothetical protein [Bosea sp. LC85]KFC70781.1 hypothetical protein FG93_02537 [Bosea sp. LC85]